MINFKRLNVIEHARQNSNNKLEFYLADILRQTSLKKVIDYVNDFTMPPTKRQLTNYILIEIEKLLDKMIVEK